MATYNTYIGARYVPLIMGAYDATKAYEPLTIVLYEGASYTSKQAVPAGVAPTNDEYWALTGNYNAQVEQYRTEVNEYKQQVTDAVQTVEEELEEQTQAFETKIAEYNENASNKTNLFNTNYNDKLSAYNTNATTKTLEYNTNAATKTEEFNAAAQQAIAALPIIVRLRKAAQHTAQAASVEFYSLIDTYLRQFGITGEGEELAVVGVSYRINGGIKKNMAYRPVQSQTQLPYILSDQYLEIGEQGWSELSISFERTPSYTGDYAAIETMDDRICIQSGQSTRLSIQNLLNCCSLCQGIASESWKHWLDNGIAKVECQPDDKEISGCTKNCDEGNQEPYSTQLIFADSVYGVSGENNIMQELYEHGPVEAVFTVYEDFYQYTSGVYSHVAGSAAGGHAVKIIGWGVDNGVKYWLCANSWGKSWGENGFFRIKRGTNECGIESSITTGLAKL